jgi:hypothetical protein
MGQTAYCPHSSPCLAFALGVARVRNLRPECLPAHATLFSETEPPGGKNGCGPPPERPAVRITGIEDSP